MPGFTTDKVTPHGYLTDYLKLAAIAGTHAVVCEVGVKHGESLVLWQHLMPHGTVIGVDYDETATWPEGTVRVIADQASPELPDLVREHAPGGCDLIVEDASHKAHLTAATFGLLWPAEGYCEAYSHLYGLSTIALRYSNVFGSLRQNEENCIASMRASYLRDGRIWLTGDGGQTRDFTHVDDICRANLLAAESGLTGPLDICTGVSTTMNEVAGYFGCPVDYRPERKGDIRHIVQDPGPAREKLGFEAAIPFAEGIKAYLP